MLITLTFYQHFTKYRRLKNYEDFDDFLSEIDDRKERKKVESFSKQMCVSSQQIFLRERALP